MIRWIQNRPWQSSLILASFSLCTFGGIDAISIGLASLAISITYSLSVFLARQYTWLSIALLVIGAGISSYLAIRPGASGLIALISVTLISAFGKLLHGYMALPVAIASGAFMLWTLVYQRKEAFSTLMGLVAERRVDDSYPFTLACIGLHIGVNALRE